MSLEVDSSVSDINSRETNALAFIEDSFGQTLGFLMDVDVLEDNTSSVENYISERPTVLKHTNTQEINNFSSEQIFLESPIVSNETILPEDKFVSLENNNQVVSVSSENNAVKDAAISSESSICKTLVKEVDNVGNSAACIQSIGSVSQPERLEIFHLSSYENNIGNNSRVTSNRMQKWKRAIQEPFKRMLSFSKLKKFFKNKEIKDSAETRSASVCSFKSFSGESQISSQTVPEENVEKFWHLLDEWRTKKSEKLNLPITENSQSIVEQWLSSDLKNFIHSSLEEPPKDKEEKS
ncbi:hypothetical protein TNIN_137811 [Trichonephila inaurata madagascariensis]|uniref:Uncharacterized protein n=1 Tax=Trichonephila inaurata madagascariensis TaxID=2747483 RepID=A0A8X7CDX3_9ARAC|nr:hypothetical protein TNIN_137811 [Trichonephila inaurata madagascariensis]